MMTITNMSRLKNLISIDTDGTISNKKVTLTYSVTKKNAHSISLIMMQMRYLAIKDIFTLVYESKYAIIKT
jgi:hypothetical protein